MDVKTIELKKLKPYEKNTRLHTEEQIRELEKSLKKFGQYRPLVVDAEGTIFVGNGLYEALKKQGAKTCEVVELPKNCTEDYKRKLMLADNKLYSLGLDNLENINEMLNELEDFKVPGFDEEALKSLFDGLDRELELETKLQEERTRKKAERERAEREEETEDYEEEEEEEEEEEREEPRVLREERELEEEEKRTKTRTLVICPKCGEEIWL